MANYKVNLRSGSGAYGGWYNVQSDDISAVALADGWFVNYVSGATPASTSSSLGGWPTSGSAAWVDNENVPDGGHRVPSSTTWVQLLITGPANTNFDLDGYSNGPSGRFVEWRLNGGTSQNIEEGTNESVVNFSGTIDGSGEALLEYREGAGSSGTGYASAIRITEVLGPEVTTTDTLQPGESFTLTATNYASAPVSPATFTDSEGSTITVAVTISGSGPYTAVGTMPTLAEAVTAGTSLLFGDVTIELST